MHGELLLAPIGENPQVRPIHSSSIRARTHGRSIENPRHRDRHRDLGGRRSGPLPIRTGHRQRPLPNPTVVGAAKPAVRNR